MATQSEIEKVLECASEQELVNLVHAGCEYAANHPRLSEKEQYELVCTMNMVAIEAERRKVEPLWRKAKRLAIRNSDTIKQIGKIAAGVTIGVIVGDALID